jgi:hypothetical protein
VHLMTTVRSSRVAFLLAILALLSTPWIGTLAAGTGDPQARTADSGSPPPPPAKPPAAPPPEKSHAYIGDAPGDMALVETDVTPEDARVLLDGKDVGSADDFDGQPGYLAIDPGKHTIAFQYKGYQTLEIDLEARPGRRYDVYRKLHKGNMNEVRRENWVHAGK